MVITSLENKKVKDIIKLYDRKKRTSEGLFIVEGEHLVKEAYKSNLLKTLILKEGTLTDIPCDDIIYVTLPVLKKISNLDTPQDMMGICYMKKEEELGSSLLILDNIQDPGNLGTIIRSAVAFNIDTIVLSKDTVDLYNSKVIRATQGMLFSINIIVRDLDEEMSKKEGEIVSCQIRRIEGDNIYVDISGSTMEGLMLKGDQVPTEDYSVGQRLKVYVRKISTDTRGNSHVLVSRTNNGFIRRLFEMEIPEIKAGLVVIKKIVREPGYRTKVAIAATDPTIDAVGACIGQKGMRITNIVDEINGENIDIVPYCEDKREFIARSLSPAKVVAVAINETLNTAKALVPDDMYLKAIGKKGYNAKLAVKLTDFKIDVKKMSEESGENY